MLESVIDACVPDPAAERALQARLWASAQRRKKYAENPEKFLQRSRDYYAANSEKMQARNRQWRLENPEASSAIARKWQAANPERVRANQRRWHIENGRRLQLQARYDLTLESWDALFDTQGRRCAICKSEKPNSKRGWSTDHCHSAGTVRGILCHRCNVALGHLDDSVLTLRSAITYLEKQKDAKSC